MEHVRVEGVEIPVLGLGTWPMKGKECVNKVKKALDLGYRHIDTAQMYNNEKEVGIAISKSDITREKIFVVTKIHPRNLAYRDVLDSVNTSLEKLDTYIDLLLIHSPRPRKPISETIEAMNELQNQGRVKHIGVSNFSLDQMKKAMEASETPILTNQVKYNFYRRQDDLLKFCIENERMLTAYSPVAKGRVTGNNLLKKIGKKYDKTEAQIALRWLIQQEFVSAIPRATSVDHQKENIDIFDFKLNKEEMEKIFEAKGVFLDRLRSKLGI